MPDVNVGTLFAGSRKVGLLQGTCRYYHILLISQQLALVLPRKVIQSPSSNAIEGSCIE